MKLSGKRALVTGGGRGIGHGIALCLGKYGADLVLGYRKDESAIQETLAELERNRQIVFRYTTPDGREDAAANPNGSLANIAGICNRERNVLGLMPHPENHIFSYQNPDKLTHPNGSGLPLFSNGIGYASLL